MSGNASNLTGFERWKNNVNPNGKIEEYELVLANRTKNFVTPAVVQLQDGTIVPAGNLTFSEISTINASYNKESSRNQ